VIITFLWFADAKRIVRCGALRRIRVCGKCPVNQAILRFSCEACDRFRLTLLCPLSTQPEGELVRFDTQREAFNFLTC
jgi:hypothetical protein